MTAQQDQWIRLIEDRLDQMEDTCIRPEELQKLQVVRESIGGLKHVLNERE